MQAIQALCGFQQNFLSDYVVPEVFEYGNVYYCSTEATAWQHFIAQKRVLANKYF